MSTIFDEPRRRPQDAQSDGSRPVTERPPGEPPPSQQCTPETDAALCLRLQQGCGALTASDNCGTPRTIASCGACGGGGSEAPPAPVNVSAAAGDQSVVLTWNASTGASSYSVERSTASGGPYTHVGTPTISGLTDTGLANGTAYYYVVRAVSSAGQSGASAEVFATPFRTNQPPVAALEVTPMAGVAPLTVDASASTSSDADGTIQSITLDFGDGATTSGASGSHTYMIAGVYSVVATVTDDDGATDTSSVSITVSGAGGASPVTPSLVASRTTGYAPLVVFFDATLATSMSPGIGAPAQGGTFRQIKHAFDFGDPGSGTHSISGLSKNSEPSGGGLAAHVFDKPGSYTVTVTSTDGVGAPASTSVVITVSDSATLPTYAISRTGNFAGAPAGATHLTQTTLLAFASNTRYFFNRGEDWSSKSLEIGDGLSNVHVDAYGSGENPIFNRVFVGAARPNTTSFANDVRVSNLTSNGGFGTENAARVLFHKCAGSNPMSTSGAGYSTGDPYRNIPQSEFRNSDEVYFVDCRLVGDGSTSDYMYYGNGSRLVFLNTHIGGTAQGTIRIVGWQRGVMRHCRVESPYSDASVHALKLHSGGPNAYADNWLASGGQNQTTLNYVNWTTSKVVIANTYFGGGDGGNATANWTVGICPQNDGYGAAGVEPLEDVILEGNKFIHASSWGGSNLDIAWGGRRLTSRNNSVVQGGGALRVGAGHTQSAADDGPYFVE